MERYNEKMPPALMRGDIVDLRSGESIRVDSVAPNRSGRTLVTGRTSENGCEIVTRWWWSNKPVRVRCAAPVS